MHAPDRLGAPRSLHVIALRIEAGQQTRAQPNLNVGRRVQPLREFQGGQVIGAMRYLRRLDL